MKRLLLLLLVVPVLGVFGGCAFMGPDDRDFFGRGWVHPTELDKERETKMPPHPETAGSLGNAPAQGSAGQGEEWATPPPY